MFDVYMCTCNDVCTMYIVLCSVFRVHVMYIHVHVHVYDQRQQHIRVQLNMHTFNMCMYNYMCVCSQPMYMYMYMYMYTYFYTFSTNSYTYMYNVMCMCMNTRYVWSVGTWQHRKAVVAKASEGCGGFHYLPLGLRELPHRESWLFSSLWFSFLSPSLSSSLLLFPSLFFVCFPLLSPSLSSSSLLILQIVSCCLCRLLWQLTRRCFTGERICREL